MPAPLDVLPLDKAKEHLNRQQIRQPGDETELEEMIGAAVERVERHLGRFPDPAAFSEVLACKVVLADYWATQRPVVTTRQSYGGRAGEEDDALASQASTLAKLTALLGAASAQPTQSAMGLFPRSSPWPDPVERGPAW